MTYLDRTLGTEQTSWRLHGAACAGLQAPYRIKALSLRILPLSCADRGKQRTAMFKKALGKLQRLEVGVEVGVTGVETGVELRLFGTEIRLRLG